MSVGADFYDRLLDNPKTPYLGPVADSPYLPMYRAVTALVPEGPVVELGCGTGRLAGMLIRSHPYIGLDFAERLLEEARAYAPEGDFRLADLRTDPIPPAPTYVATEVLEHLDDDLALLRRLPLFATVILSAPSFASESHVRWFADQGDARRRYDRLLLFDHEEFIDLPRKGAFFHILRGVRR